MTINNQELRSKIQAILSGQYVEDVKALSSAITHHVQIQNTLNSKVVSDFVNTLQSLAPSGDLKEIAMEIASKYSEDTLKSLGLNTKILEVLSLSLSGVTAKYVYRNSDDEVVMVAESNIQDHSVIVDAVENRDSDRFDVFNKSNAIMVAEYLVVRNVNLEKINLSVVSFDESPISETNAVKGSRGAVKPRYVFKEDGDIRVWSGRGVPPKSLASAKELDRQGFPNTLKKFEISDSESNEALYTEYLAQEKKEDKREPKKVNHKYVFVEKGLIRAWSGRGISPLTLADAKAQSLNGNPAPLKEFEIDNSDANAELYEKFLAQEEDNKAKESTRKPRAKMPARFVFMDDGEIRTWTGVGIAPVVLKEPKANGDLDKYLISYSDENLELYEAFKEKELSKLNLETKDVATSIERPSYAW